MLRGNMGPPEDDEIVLSTIVTPCGNNCNEYRENLLAGKVPVPACCPTCLQETIERNGYYRNRQVKTASPVDIPGEYPEPVGHIDLIKLRCTNPPCPQRHHTILPSFLAPYQQYVNSVRQMVMDSANRGATVYALACQLRLFPWLIRRWIREAEELAGRVVGPVLTRIQDVSPDKVAAAVSGKSVSMWSYLMSAVLVLVLVDGHDPKSGWSKDRLLEFVYVFCSERRELRFWDRSGRRRRKESRYPTSVALSVPDPG